MAIYRAQISFMATSTLPRDAMTLNPHYFGDNAQGLADALKTNLVAHVDVGALKTFKVKIYDAEKAPPSYPLAEAGSGTDPFTVNYPRELALCLSYYAIHNRPTLRGRLFIPQGIIGGALALRPTPAQMASALSFTDTFASNLPANTHWCVYSRKLKIQTAVTNTWVDDEWDIIRSRGLRPTTRIEDVV